MNAIAGEFMAVPAAVADGQKSFVFSAQSTSAPQASVGGFKDNSELEGGDQQHTENTSI